MKTSHPAPGKQEETPNAQKGPFCVQVCSQALANVLF